MRPRVGRSVGNIASMRALVDQRRREEHCARCGYLLTTDRQKCEGCSGGDPEVEPVRTVCVVCCAYNWHEEERRAAGVAEYAADSKEGPDELPRIQ